MRLYEIIEYVTQSIRGTHRDPVIFEVKTSFIFPPEGGGFRMPAWRLTLETGSLPNRHHHILWVLPEVIA